MLSRHPGITVGRPLTANVHLFDMKNRLSLNKCQFLLTRKHMKTRMRNRLLTMRKRYDITKGSDDEESANDTDEEDTICEYDD